MISFESSGSFDSTDTFLRRMLRGNTFESVLKRYGQEGVDALKNATPVDSRLTADSWYYTVEKVNGVHSLTFHNRNVVNGIPVAIIIQYGHGTGTGGYVTGRDYINPAIRPVFDKIVDELTKAVRR